MEKLYRYLLLFGLMIPVFIPIGSLALRVPDGQVMLFGISWHPHLDIYTSLAEFDGRWFLDDSGKMIHGSDGKPVKAEIGTFGIFLKNKAPYLFEIMRPGTARTLGADKYKWIRENVKSKWMKPNKIIMRPHTIMQGIFSCMNYDLNAKLNQSGIHKYLGKKNEYVLGWLRAAMNDFVGWLNGLEIKNKQAMDFNTLYYKIRESFIWWLCKMANTAKAYAGTNAYLELDDPINSNENKSGIVSSAVMVEFWSNHDNAGICEFWDATMAWFLCVLEESGVRNAKGISLIELVKEEFLWLVECVGLFLGNDQPSDEVMTNVVTEGCMVQLKNYCYLLYHYKKKIYDVLDSVSTYMKSDADLMRIKDLIGKLCKQWDGRNLEKIVLPLAAMDVKSINKFNKINEFLYDEDRNSTLNVEADLIALNDVLSDTYNNNEANAAAKETLLRAMDYTHDVIQVLCHIRNYSSWIKDNLETYCNEFASEQDQPEQKGLTEQEQSLPANMYPALKNMTLSGIDKCVYFPQNKIQSDVEPIPPSVPLEDAVSSVQNDTYNSLASMTLPGSQPEQKQDLSASAQKQKKQYKATKNQPEQKGLTEQEQSLPANMYPALKNMTLSGIDKCVYFPQNKIQNDVEPIPSSVPLEDAVSSVQNDTYNSLASMTLPGSSTSSSLYNTYTPSQGKTFMSKTLPRKGKMRSNLNKTGRLNKSFGQGKHPKSRENSNDNKKRKHRKVAD